jgi:hypothetical protein
LWDTRNDQCVVGHVNVIFGAISDSNVSAFGRKAK